MANTHTFTLVNPGAELGSTSGWTAVGGFNVKTSGPAPKSGTYYFSCASGSSGGGYQNISITDPVVINDIDTNACVFFFSWWQASFDTSSDLGTVRIEFFDGGGASLGSTALPSTAPGQTFQLRKYEGNAVPRLTRTVRVQMVGTRVGGTVLDAHFDDLSNFVIYYDTGVTGNVTSEYTEIGFDLLQDTSNITAGYTEIGFDVPLDTSNVTTSYAEVGYDIVAESSNVTINYAEVGYDIQAETSNVTTEYIEVGANSTPPEPRITAEYVEVSINAAITPTITSEYVELGTKAISFANLTSEYVELGLKAVSNSDINLTSQYAEVSTNTGFGQANVYQSYIEIESGIEQANNIKLMMLAAEATTTLPGANANVVHLSAEIILGGANNAANIHQLYAEYIVSVLKPQVLVAGI